MWFSKRESEIFYCFSSNYFNIQFFSVFNYFKSFEKITAVIFKSLQKKKNISLINYTNPQPKLMLFIHSFAYYYVSLCASFPTSPSWGVGKACWSTRLSNHPHSGLSRERLPIRSPQRTWFYWPSSSDCHRQQIDLQNKRSSPHVCLLFQSSCRNSRNCRSEERKRTRIMHQK